MIEILLGKPLKNVFYGVMKVPFCTTLRAIAMHESSWLLPKPNNIFVNKTNSFVDNLNLNYYVFNCLKCNFFF